MSYISGTTNYPDDYDLSPSGTGVATLSYVLDQIRDPQTGIVIQSGDTVVAKDVNSAYTIIQKIEEVVGLNPGGVWPSIRERLDYLEYTGSLAFVPLSGGSMFGDLHIIDGSGLYTASIISTGLIWQNYFNGIEILNTGTFNISSSGNIGITGLANSNIDLTSNTLTVNNANSYIYSSNNLNASGNISTISAADIVRTFAPNGLRTSGNITPEIDSQDDIGTTLRYYDNIYVNNIISTGADANYLNATGDTVLGNLSLNTGVSIDIVESGTGYIGDPLTPIGSISTKQLNASVVSGLSPILVASDLYINDVVHITFSGSGTSDIGSSGNPVGTLYADNIVVQSGLASLPYVEISGDTMTGDLTMDTGVNIVLVSGSVYPQASGTGTIGTTGNYFDNVYTNNVNGLPFGTAKFHEQLSGTGNGVNKNFYFVYPPIVGINAAMVFSSGLLLKPGSDYTISGSGLTLGVSFPAPVDVSGIPYAAFYLY